jgi:hypothetical protein
MFLWWRLLLFQSWLLNNLVLILRFCLSIGLCFGTDCSCFIIHQDVIVFISWEVSLWQWVSGVILLVLILVEIWFEWNAFSCDFLPQLRWLGCGFNVVLLELVHWWFFPIHTWIRSRLITFWTSSFVLLRSFGSVDSTAQHFHFSPSVYLHTSVCSEYDHWNYFQDKYKLAWSLLFYH